MLGHSRRRLAVNVDISAALSRRDRRSRAIKTWTARSVSSIKTLICERANLWGTFHLDRISLGRVRFTDETVTGDFSGVVAAPEGVPLREAKWLFLHLVGQCRVPNNLIIEVDFTAWKSEKVILPTVIQPRRKCGTENWRMSHTRWFNPDREFPLFW